MKSQTMKFCLIGLMALALVACGGDDKSAGSAAKQIAQMDTDTPDGAFKANLVSLRNNDIKSLLKNSLSQDQYNELVNEFESNKGKEFSEQEKMQFEQTMALLTSDGAEDQIMAMIGPQLEQAKAMMPMMVMMKPQMIEGIKSNPQIPEGQRDAAAKVVSAMVDWATENDILSEDMTRKAVGVVVQTARDLDMNSLEELKGMSFDQAMNKAGVAVGGLKDVLAVYDISVDDMLDSVEIMDVDTAGDVAKLKMAWEIFGERIEQDVKLVKKNDRWVNE